MLKVVYRDLNSDASLTAMEQANRVPFYPPVEPKQFVDYAFWLIALGFWFMALFVVDLLNPKKQDQSLLKQLVFSAISSAFLGIGIMFVIMECGVYI